MQLGNRNSQHSFAQTPAVHMARSQFDRSFQRKSTFDFDYLVPIFVDEILPGDTCNLSVNTFARLATQIVPIMDNMYVDYFFFFVPTRLVWTNWEKFNGAQTNPGDSTSFVVPVMDDTAGGGYAVESIFDYFGLPTEINGIDDINCLPLRCYNLIWNTWFRDENLQNSVVVSTDNGPDQDADFTLLKRGKRHDYFTSCLTSPQKGTSVTLPIGTTAPLIIANPTTNPWKVRDSTTGAVYFAGAGIGSDAAGLMEALVTTDDLILDPNGRLVADLTNASAATINQLRQAFQVQSLLELDARGGTRYVEILLAHFNVTSPDFRLQRPEFLGGGSSKINSHVVPQTSPTSGTDPQAQLAAFATHQGQGIGFTKSFVEHGYVIGLACARADITYQQGLERMWSRSTRYDFFWPKLQELGEQSVLNKEIYCDGSATDITVFGYQERYAEYRYKPSQITGKFRSTYATPLDFWHMAEEFGALPTLSSTFIVQNTPVDRAIAIPTEPHLLFDAWYNYKHTRPMMTYSVPVSLGRF